MNALWLRLLNSTYRKEPIASFVITVGIVDTVIATLGASGSLFCFGLGTVGVAVIFRWWHNQGSAFEQSNTDAEYYLPSRTTSQARLPVLKETSRRGR
jgi:hypothetical protein